MMEWVPLGCLILSVGFLMLRTHALRSRSLQRNPLKESQQEIVQRMNSPVGKIHQLEARLHDYGREVEGRVETTMLVLDQLILDAQKESDRLEHLLLEFKKLNGDDKRSAA